MAKGKGKRKKRQNPGKRLVSPAVAAEQPANSGASQTRTGHTNWATTTLYTAVALSAVAALLHLWVAPEHFNEWWGHGTFFLVVAAAQGILSLALLRWPEPPLLALGIAGNLFIIILYAVSRTAGVPFFGPHAGEVEPVGATDLLATAAEVGVILSLAALLRQPDWARASEAGQFQKTDSRRPVVDRLIRVGAPMALVLMLAAVLLARSVVWPAQTEGHVDSHSDETSSAPTLSAIGTADSGTLAENVSHDGHDHGQGTATDAKATTPDSPALGPMLSQKASASGVDVELSVGPIDDRDGVEGVVAGQFADIRIELKDSSTGEPVAPVQRPAVWIDLQKEMRGEKSPEKLTCDDKLRLYTQGTVSYRPDIDLNTYFVLALNDDASISVIDPLVGVTGISQLYSMVLLSKPGEDWALTEDGKRLFVSMPEANQVAVADMESFKVLKNIDAGASPVRVAFQPKGKYLWVGNDSADGKKSGVTVIDVARLEVVAQIQTGKGHHDIAFSDDGLYAFVTNSRNRNVSIIDVLNLKKLVDIETGSFPLAVVFSSATGAAYVADASDGKISVIDPASPRIVKQVKVGTGLNDFGISHDGMWGFALDTAASLVHVFDVSAARVISSLPVVKGPDQMAVTHTYIYVRSKTSPEVSIIDLTKLGQSSDLPVLRIIAGQNAPADSPFTSVADAIAPIQEHGNHVLIANPADSYIYYYMEGMQAPMGGFQNYMRSPRAVRVLDRSIRETGPGRYEGKALIAQEGEYQVAFLLDEPRITQCFSFTAKPSALVAQESQQRPLDIQFITADRETRAGEKLHLQFRLSDKRDNSPVLDAGDVYVIATLASGLSRERYQAKHTGGGIYEVEIVFPNPGTYRAFFTIPSAQVAFDQLPSLVVQVKD